MFIDMLIRHIDLGAVGSDEWKPNSTPARPLRLQKHSSHTRENQVANRRTPNGRLLLELSIERTRNIDFGPDRFFFHFDDYFTWPPTVR